MRLSISVIAVMLGIGLITPSAQAEIIGCYAATYNKAHMAKYPGQTPTALAVRITKQDSNTIMEIKATLRGKPGKWSEGGGCNANGKGLDCYIDCDGGGFTLEPSATGVTLFNSRSFRLTKDGCDGEAEYHMVEPVPGNRMFALKQSANKRCE